MSSPHRPVQAPPPFPPPILLSARRVTGTVSTAPQGNNKKPPPFERRSSMAGANILLVQDNHNPKAQQLAFLLQRKIKASVHGHVRLGYVLRYPSESECGMWELVSKQGSEEEDDDDDDDNEEDSYEMVAVKIKQKTEVLDGQDKSENLSTQLAALHWIASNESQGSRGHLLGPAILAEDDFHVYTITPYHSDGSLLDFCAQAGSLRESEARFIFRQLLQGLETLKQLELCHRNLSLENILLQGTTCTIGHFENALRIPTAADNSYLIEPQLPAGTNPQCVAPELFQNQPFDGYAVDLWSTAVMLFLLLLGNDALFDAPVCEDKKFKEICIRGNLKGALERWQDDDKTAVLSDDALDLLQSMLRAEPRDRLTLEQVQAHVWVTADEATPPPLTRTSSVKMGT